MSGSFDAAAVLARLEEACRSKGSVITAFSGGVDSAVVAAIAERALGERALAVIVDSESFARAERDAAVAFARELGLRHEVVTHSELADERYAANPVDRCYFCRQGLADVTLGIAAARGFATVAVGTNANDLGDYRPGLAAIQERELWQPFLEVGVDKAGVRALARHLGLTVADKPAMACLSSRIPYGDRVTLTKLKRIGAAEDHLRGLGFKQVRVRTYDDGARARIEVEAGSLPRLQEALPDVERALVALGYDTVEVDARGYRTGSLNDAIPVTLRARHSA